MPENSDKAYEYFKKVREEKGLSIVDIANTLHLNITVIEQIEAGDFSNGRFAPVFMRGYIRSYGKYLNLSDDIIHHIIGLLDISSPNVSPLFSIKEGASKKQVSRRRRRKKIVMYGLVVILFIAISVLWHHARTPVVTVADNTMMTVDNEPITPQGENIVVTDALPLPAPATEPPPAVINPVPVAPVETSVANNNAGSTSDVQPDPIVVSDPVKAVVKKAEGPEVVDAEETV